MTTGEHDGQVGLRERKKRETRAALSQATLRLSLERGWGNVSVEDIAAAANVSVRTFRNYFSSKAEAVAATHLDRMLRIGDALCARPRSKPLWEAVANAVIAQFAAGDSTADGPSGRQRMNRIWLVLNDPEVQGETLKANAAAQVALAEAVARRTGTDVSSDVYPKLVAAAVGAAITTVTEHCLRAEGPAEMGPLLRDAFEQLAAGLPIP
ncbi:acyl-CoA-like ligand-binding transcription factor [Streptomyces sp. 8N114]|uniref:acyl-CoA-like ligand-binding transcription factor n=1 Tax=Streptomyces sp. 8N114 TaxID=3457419 RepID=UPI003FD43C9B